MERLTRILIVASLVALIHSAPYCELKSSAPNLIVTMGENFVISTSEIFNGYNMTFAAESSNVAAKQTANTVAFTQFAFQNPLSHDIWKRTDGSSMHVILDEVNNYKTLYFGSQASVGSAIKWNFESSVKIPLRNCFSATLVKYDVAAVDCYDYQNGVRYNVWYTISYTNPSNLVPQNFTDNWRQAVTSISGRKTVKYFSSELLGIQSNWGQRVRSQHSE
jgi:hypothetical protein